MGWGQDNPDGTAWPSPKTEWKKSDMHIQMTKSFLLAKQ